MKVMLKTSPQKIKEIREDYMYEFVNLLKYLSDKEELSEEVFDQVYKSLESDHANLEQGYNVLKRIITGSFLRINKAQTTVQHLKPIELEFYESFDDRATMKKKQAADLCEKSETWIHGVKPNFCKEGEALFVKPFLKWLKVYNIKYYDTFKKNFNKPD